MCPWVPASLEPSWAYIVSEDCPLDSHTRWGGGCFLSKSQLPSLLPATGGDFRALSTGLPQTGSCPLVLCHDASLALVPMVALKGEWPKGTPNLNLSSVSTPTLIIPPTCSLGYKGLGCWVWLLTAWQAVHRPASSTTLGSSSLTQVLPFSKFCSGPHCPALPPDPDGKLSILSLTDFHGFKVEEAGTGVSVLPPQKALCAPLEN